MPIVRANRKDPYTHLYNETIRDKRLSFKARGLLAYMLSMSDGWEFHTTELVKQSEHDGIDSIKSALKELETCGYIRRGQERTSNGKFGKQTMKVYDTPAFSPQVEKPLTGKPLTGKPSTVQPLTDNPPLRTNNNKNYQLKKKPSRRKRVYDKESDYFKLANYLDKLIHQNEPNSKSNDLQLWADDMRKLVEIDKRDKHQIALVIRWAEHDPFWSTNILSAAKLRKQFDQLSLKMKAEQAKPSEPQGSNQSQFTDQVAVTRRNEFVFTIYSEHQPNLDDAVPEIQRKYPELSELVIKQILWPEKYGDPGGVTNGDQQVSSAN